MLTFHSRTQVYKKQPAVEKLIKFEEPKSRIVLHYKCTFKMYSRCIDSCTCIVKNVPTLLWYMLHWHLNLINKMEMSLTTEYY